jgi:hypothetical protein
MNCSFCKWPTETTARDSKGNLYNCCDGCKREKQLNVSTIMKEGCNFDPKKERRD